jgi:hypothetical protein
MGSALKAEETIMTSSASVKDKALSFDELDRVAGGIIIVGGLPQLSQRFTSTLDRIALNPQPLPPRILFGH